jgi:hypothetical protein
MYGGRFKLAAAVDPSILRGGWDHREFSGQISIVSGGGSRPDLCIWTSESAG